MNTEPTSSHGSDAVRFEDILPWYVNGTANKEDIAWLESYLAANPSLLAKVQSERILKSHVLNAADDFNVEKNLVTVLSQIRAVHAKPVIAPKVVSHATRSTWLRWALWLRQVQLSPITLGIVTTLCLLQTVAIVFLYDKSTVSYSESRTAKAQGAFATSVLLRVNFFPDASEETIRMAIGSIQGVIVHGPGALGDYYVRSDMDKSKIISVLTSAQGVHRASIVSSIPVRD